MDIAITGTPGTGKTTLCKELKARGHAVLSVADLAIDMECAVPGDINDQKEMEVDVSSLAAKMHGYTAGRGSMLPSEGGDASSPSVGDYVFLDGHLSHHLPADLIIVLRYSPKLLVKRLETRGYSAEKVQENLEAEGVGVCLSEAVETPLPVAEIDTTDLDTKELADIVMDLVDKAGVGEDVGEYEPGSVDWTEEVSNWY